MVTDLVFYFSYSGVAMHSDFFSRVLPKGLCSLGERMQCHPRDTEGDMNTRKLDREDTGAEISQRYFAFAYGAPHACGYSLS